MLRHIPNVECIRIIPQNTLILAATSNLRSLEANALGGIFKIRENLWGRPFVLICRYISYRIAYQI